jgi:hypothetical protein
MVDFLKHVFKNDPDQEATMMQAKWNGKVSLKAIEQLWWKETIIFRRMLSTRNFFRKAAGILYVQGKAQPAIMISKWKEKSIQLLPGTIRVPKKPPGKLKAISPFGMELKFAKSNKK